MLTLSTHQARAILAQTGEDGPVLVTNIARGNDVWRLDQGGKRFYLKTHTKEWYAGDPSAPGQCIQHEVAAYETLAAHHIPVPEVLAAEIGSGNPFGRPFLLTRALDGTSLTALLLAHGHQDREFRALLHEAGAYLRRVHEIPFRFPGYLMNRSGPEAPPEEDAWQDPIWTAKQAQCEALALLEADRHRLSPVVAREMGTAFSTLAETLAPMYGSPHFVHGDCHVEQFFLESNARGWFVSGFVDMEVASAGAVEYDLLKMALEMMSRFSPETRWWEPLFAGYGREPDFEWVRLLLLSSSEASFRAHGPERWPATREESLAGLLAAHDWKTLFTKPR